MTYANFENSRESGTPIELYEFTQGLQRWNYISGADLIVFLGQTYSPMPVQRDRVKQNGDIFKNGMKLTFPRDDVFASQFLGFSPETPTTVTIRRGHFGDPDSEFIVYWKGRVLSATASGNQIDLGCESVFTSLKRPGLRAKFEYTCRRTLYRKGCNVNSEAFRHDGLVIGMDGTLGISVAGAGLQPDGYYTGGMLTAPDGSSRFITKHVGDTVTISRPINSLTGSQLVSIYPGCDHLRETCLNKFNNLPNFGGFPFIPGRNPFDGSSLFS